MLCSSGLIVVSLTGNVLTKQIHKTCMRYKFFLPTYLVQTCFHKAYIYRYVTQIASLFINLIKAALIKLINTDAVCVTYRYM